MAGVVYTDASQGFAYLPLDEVTLNGFIVDVSARITLRQTFSNPSEVSTGRAKYAFPIPARASVCAFELEHSDGRTIIGVSKEKFKAAEEHLNAINAGKSTALVEWVTDDTFTISIGPVPANSKVVAKLVFVMDLFDDELRDQVRLQLPVSLGCRYGDTPTALVDTAAATSSTRLRFTIDIQTSGVIQKVFSPTHQITHVPYITHTSAPSRRRRTAKFRSRTFLQTDFILCILADGLDSPRCFAERDPTRLETIAMQLTMVPHFKLPPLPAQEYLFLVDRSGSMGGSRITTAARTLGLLLRMLPSNGTVFNIFSFGSRVDSIFGSSTNYSQSSLSVTTKHVQGMTADYGGTEIANALNFVFNSRNLQMPTVVFVLTDGESYDIDNTINIVRGAVTSAPAAAPLRVFTLGIGDTVSSAMVEGIARAGNGECLYAVSSESIVGKCVKLFRAGRSTFIDNITIDWGFPTDSQPTGTPSVTFSHNTGGMSSLVELVKPPPVQQTPPQIVKIYPGTRFVASVIATYMDIPSNIVLRGQLRGSEQPVEFIVPVSHVAPFHRKQPDIPLVHTLAAQGLIHDLQESRTPIPPALNGTAPEEDRLRAAVVRLGEKYQLVSRFTSFVAVGKEGGEQEFEGSDSDWENLDTGENTSGNGPSVPNRRRSRGRQRTSRRQTTPPSNHEPVPPVPSGWSSYIFGGLSRLSSGITHYLGYKPRDAHSDVHQGGQPSTRHRSSSTDTYSTMSSLNGSLSDWTPPHSPERPPAMSEEERERRRAPSPSLESINSAPPSVQQQFANNQPPFDLPSQFPSSSQDVPKNIIELVHLQSFDGSYTLDERLSPVLGRPFGDLVKPVDVVADDKVWATALAVALLQQGLEQAGQADLLEGLLDKALEYVDRVGPTGANFDLLVSRAKTILARP